MMIVYRDADFLVCRKPAGALSTDEPGGVPELLRRELGFTHLRSGKRMDFEQFPPEIEPWTSFNNLKTVKESY